MPEEPCPRCGGPHPFHVVVRARSTRRWRGRNLDAAAAEAAAGAALLRALGLDASREEDFARFARLGIVVSAREEVEENPPERFDPATGEAWEFHLALREALPEPQAEGARAAVREAVAGARNFRLEDAA